MRQSVWRLPCQLTSSRDRGGGFDFLARLGGHGSRGGLDRLDDVLVAGAAAEVPLDPQPDLLLGWLRIAFQQLLGRHDHARRAVAALQAMLVPEGLLQRVQLAPHGQALDGRDLGAVGLHGKDGARLDAVAVHLDGTGPAAAGGARDVGAGQARLLANVVDEQRARFDLVFVLGAIDRHRHPVSHGHLLWQTTQTRTGTSGPKGPGLWKRPFPARYSTGTLLCLDGGARMAGRARRG